MPLASFPLGAKMILRRFLPAAALCFLIPALVLAQELPAGTVLPVMLSTTLDSARSKPGEEITARLSQEVLLAAGQRIPAGAKIHGRVVESSLAANSAPARLSVRFDSLSVSGRQVPILASLRAVASMQDVFDAQLPWNTFDDYGTSSSDWNTVQVGGAAVYRGDGTVRSAMEVIGRATDSGAVTARLQPNPKFGCPAKSGEGEREQSLWVFSPWACGCYGFDDLAIAHHGSTSPVGTIELTSSKAIHIRAGSGLLLRVVPSPGPGSAPTPR